LIVPGAYAGSPLLSQKDVWDILERYAHDVAACEKVADQKALALAAVRDSLGADAVYWFPGASGEEVNVVGDHDLPAEWCVAFAKKLLDETPGLDGRLLRSVVPPASRGAAFQPHSAAMVRVSKSKSNWIVALSLSPRRCFQVTDLRIMTVIRQILVNERRRVELTNRMADTMSWLVQCLTTSIDAHIPHARGHSERVAKIAMHIGKRMNLPTSVLNDLYFAGLLHDIGITGVQQSLLLKPGILTEEEYAQVKTYPILGDDILAGIKQLGHLRPAVRHHHERYDGRGYPDGLRGEEIPLMGRILSVADAFDAMLSPRPHRPALAGTRVDTILAQGAGQEWDPTVIESFMVCRSHLHALCETPAKTESIPAVHYVVKAWNAHSSRNVSVCGSEPGDAPPPDGLAVVAVQSILLGSTEATAKNQN